MFIRLTFGNNKAQPPRTARPRLSDLARANYGTSVVAKCNAWSAGKIPKPHTLQLCAPVTKVRKRGGRRDIIITRYATECYFRYRNGWERHLAA